MVAVGMGQGSFSGPLWRHRGRSLLTVWLQVIREAGGIEREGSKQYFSSLGCSIPSIFLSDPHSYPLMWLLLSRFYGWGN